ncbi:MAG: leucine-rich repeat domain-containing protein, partial [Lachnospiraceae bacterium]|nr:leucine-rich repeat domain-containing protein [Lachnospiraceae bacterium]
VGNGVLAYSIFENKATIEYYRGKDIAVIVPETIEDSPVVAIGKKAFLSAKTLSRIEIPQSVAKIGDWAFASCSRLAELVLPKKKIEIGSGVFKDCGMLEQIVLRSEDRNKETCDNDDVFYLLAAAVSKLDAQYLFDVINAGTVDWFEHFDSTVTQLMMKDDSDGFSKMLLCGEEDYVGDDSNFDTYCLMKQKAKVRILLLRLLHSAGIDENAKARFASYLKEHMDNVTWRVVLDEHGDEREYFDLLLDYECINNDNISRLIESMGEHNTGMKGYLMKVKSEQMNGSGFMDDLDL